MCISADCYTKQSKAPQQIWRMQFVQYVSLLLKNAIDCNSFWNEEQMKNIT